MRLGLPADRFWRTTSRQPPWERAEPMFVHGDMTGRMPRHSLCRLTRPFQLLVRCVLSDA